MHIEIWYLFFFIVFLQVLTTPPVVGVYTRDTKAQSFQTDSYLETGFHIQSFLTSKMIKIKRQIKINTKFQVIWLW